VKWSTYVVIRSAQYEKWKSSSSWRLAALPSAPSLFQKKIKAVWAATVS
jgi:hypothetical protein